MKLKTKKYTIIAIALLVILSAIVYVSGRAKSSAMQNGTAVQSSTQNAEKAGSINREFSFPIKNEKGEEISQLKYTIESAELRDEIYVKGQKATAVPGRTFLIISVKLSNSLDKTIQINTRDYVRLVRNGNAIEPLAPEIHNDPVEVQPISTKTTHIGFPINESDTDLQLQVGEIKGSKELIPIVFN
jgi:hypothetical protein